MSGSSRTRVVSVVLSYERKADLVACLESVLQLEYEPHEIVVVDNCSTDGSADVVEERFPELHLVRSPANLGAPGGRNLGARYARERLSFDAILFLDDDTIVEPGYLAELERVFSEDASAGIVCGKGYVAPPSQVLNSAGVTTDLWRGRIRQIGIGELDRGQHDRGGYVDACDGFGFLIDANLFQELGGLDEGFGLYGFEDTDICLRARRLGFKTLYTPAALIHHKGCKIGRGPIPRYERSKIRSYFRLLARHTTFWQKLTCAIYVPLEALRVVISLLRAGQLRAVGAQLLGAIDSLLPNREGRE